jgi:phosphatidylcholine synthase
LQRNHASVTLGGAWRVVAQLLAWSAHVYTALGLVAAGGIAVLILQGRPAAFSWAFVLMLVATIIDATDGTLARRVRVKEVLPGFDGRRLDDLIDFLTYTFLPLLLLWQADVLPPGQGAWLLLPLLASAYGFCQVSSKTEDGFFLGFPSYWNMVAFYLYVLRLPDFWPIMVLVAFSFLTFVPVRYLYPVWRGRLNQLTTGLGAVWAALLVWILYRLLTVEPLANGAPDIQTQWLAVVSLLYPGYYLIASWLVSLRIWRTRRHRIQEA